MSDIKLNEYQSLYHSSSSEIREWYQQNRQFLLKGSADPIWEFLRNEILSGRYLLFLEGLSSKLIPYWCANAFLETASLESLSLLDPKTCISLTGREILFRRALREEALIDRWASSTYSKIDYAKFLHLVLTLEGENNYRLLHSLGKEYRESPPVPKGKGKRKSRHGSRVCRSSNEKALERVLSRCPRDVQWIFSTTSEPGI